MAKCPKCGTKMVYAQEFLPKKKQKWHCNRCHREYPYKKGQIVAEEA